MSIQIHDLSSSSDELIELHAVESTKIIGGGFARLNKSSRNPLPSSRGAEIHLSSGSSRITVNDLPSTGPFTLRRGSKSGNSVVLTGNLAPAISTTVAATASNINGESNVDIGVITSDGTID